MAKSSQAVRQKSKPPPEQQELLERLVETVERLEGELRFIRETLDRIQDDFAWNLNNDPARQDSWLPASPPLQITSLPRDPLAPDFGERINKVTQDEQEALRNDEAASVEQKAESSVETGHLF
jgi:hypothetical protein